MKIIITDRGSKSFYQEVVNVTIQYNKLLRNPEARLTNSFKAWKRYIIWSLILLALAIIETVLWGASAFMWITIIILVLLGASSAVALFSYSQQVNAMLNDDADAELTLDDEGIELSKASMIVRLSWDNIAFARIFKESVCFIPRKRTGMIIAVSLRYYDEIFTHIKSKIYGNK